MIRKRLTAHLPQKDGVVSVKGHRRPELQVAAILSACLRQPGLSEPPPTLIEAQDSDTRRMIVSGAIRHRVAGAVHLQTRNLGWSDADGAADLRDAYSSTISNHMWMTRELVMLKQLLDQTGVDWLTFKGPALVASAYPRPDVRSYGDLDLLVAPAALDVVLDALHGAGATIHVPSWDFLRETEQAQLPILMPRGVVLDLHWHVSNGPQSRLQFPMSTARLFAQSTDIAIGDLVVRGLDRAQTLIHLCLHGAMSGGERLVWVLDVHLAANHIQDWEAVIFAAHESRTGLVVAIMLGRAMHLLGTDLPTGLLDDLSGARTWRATVRALDRLRPPQAHVLGTGRMIFTSTRHTTQDSLRHLLSAALKEAVVPLFTTAEHPWRVALRGSSSLRTKRQSVQELPLVSNDPGRTRYLAWAVAQG